jgi:hypothetical protein
VLVLWFWSIAAWVPPSTFSIGRSSLLTTATTLREKGPFDFSINPYESKIPEEIKHEIYTAKAAAAV